MIRSDTPRKPSPSLSIRLLAYVVMPLLVSLAAAGVLVLQELERKFERRMQEDVELVARALQRPVSHALERGHQRTIDQALASALQIGRVYGAHIYDHDGELMLASGKADGRRPPLRARRLSGDDRGAGRYGHVGHEAVYSYFVPVRLGGARVGLLEVSRRREDIDAFMGKLRIQALAVLATAGILMSLIVLAGYRGAVGTALDSVLASIRRVQAGDVQHRAQPNGPREVTTLVHAFNTMLDSLRAAEEAAAIEREDRLSLQLRLAESKKLAAVGHLAAGIAHELGTPLATVAGRVQRVLRRTELPEEVRRELHGVEHEARRMERIVRNVLDFGRHDGGSRWTTCSAETLAHMAVAAVRQEAEQAAVRLVVAESEHVRVCVDVVRAEQALSNLVRNAIQAVASTGGGEVVVAWRIRDGWIDYMVDDDGPGIPPEDLPRVFDPFFTTKRDQDGTGLGLGIVLAIAREHGGAVQIRPLQHRGTRATLTLPSPVTATNARDEAV